MNENDLRDCFAMFAMNGILKNYSMAEVFDNKDSEMLDYIAKDSYKMADAMLNARKAKEELGIVAVKRSPTTRRSK